MEIYEGYEILKNEVGYYEASKINDCDSLILYAKTKEQLKIEIKEQSM